jgi:thiol-disulfide isomerase/thioredoxin
MRTTLLPCTLCALLIGCDAASSDDEHASDGGESESESETESETSETISPDADGDGLDDETEAAFGTDPHDVDTDDDNYWDAWELAEGTDPLDPDSRIYTGWWPYQPDKDSLPQSTWDTASQAEGAAFPRDTYLDQHGDSVDLHDFAHFDQNALGQPAPLLIDVAAQWCGPCHSFGSWIAEGEPGSDAHWPTVRAKLADARFWWITVIVQDMAGGAPTLADATAWDGQHHHPRVPVLVDSEQHVVEHFSGGQFPHFFLLDPAMQIEFFPHETNSSDYYPAITMIDKYL